MPQIFIANECDSENLGDQAINANAQRFFKHHGYSVVSWALNNGYLYEDGSRFRGVNSNQSDVGNLIKKMASPLFLNICRKIALPVWAVKYYLKLKAISQAMSESQLLLIGGGGVLMNNNLHFPIAIFFLSRVALKRQVAFGLAGVSLGGELKGLSKLLLRSALSNAKFCYLRDPDSKRYVQNELGVSNAKIGPDFALIGPVESVLKRSQHQTYRIGFNVAENSANLHQIDYAVIIEAICKCIVSLNPTVECVIFTTGWPKDLAVAASIFNKVNKLSSCKVFLQPKPVNLHELEQFIGTLDLVVGMRLHASILALSCGVKAIGLPASPKIKGFFSGLDLQDFYVEASSDEEFACRLISCIHIAKDRRVKFSEIVSQQYQMALEVLSTIQSAANSGD